MATLGWSDLIVSLISLGYGLLSGLVPVLNAEVYIAAAQASPRTAGALAAAALGLGQTVAKIILFGVARRGGQVASRRRADPTVVEAGSESAEDAHRSGRSDRGWRRQWTRFTNWVVVLSNRLLELVSTRRWGIPIVALSAFVGLPPLYAVAVIAGLSRMRIVTFGLTTLAGRCLRFILIAVGATAGLAGFFSG